jgi:tRNA threonylcarbamoyladenosine biosynthesis protein TsaB
MSLILNIDTATEKAGIALTQDGRVFGTAVNDQQKDHAAWIQVAIRDLLESTGYKMKDLKAVAVTAGPGSYTGLRVGMASAKGICYALQIPLITGNTLRVMAYAAIEQLKSLAVEKKLWLCPMIDARRMEVFAAVYDDGLQVIMPPAALVLEDVSFKEQLNNHRIVFFGNGSDKWKPVCSHPNAMFREWELLLAPSLGKLATERFSAEKFADLAYEIPVYLKEFYTYIKK